MQDIIKQSKSLSDEQLSTLIKKLSSQLEKRQLKAKRREEEQKQQLKVQNELMEKINSLAAEKGVSLEQLGYVHQSSLQKPAKQRRGRPVISAENQTFVLKEGEPQLVFTRKAKELLDQGKAYRFNQLSPDQQAMARAATAAYNAR
ncbi:MAG: hypothetical protein CML22_07200 [Rheinheimera sp.]|nr:hypothetical protein [Rheinheimera sp.]MBM34070.1 hypothetical protein [Rheinheimera sp.]|tara:strand:+ start:2566 stop:3003 length:438 start_codon:yes stop_codon:yes gene_type:complete